MVDCLKQRRAQHILFSNPVLAVKASRQNTLDSFLIMPHFTFHQRTIILRGVWQSKCSIETWYQHQTFQIFSAPNPHEIKYNYSIIPAMTWRMRCTELSSCYFKTSTRQKHLFLIELISKLGPVVSFGSFQMMSLTTVYKKNEGCWNFYHDVGSVNNNQYFSVVPQISPVSCWLPPTVTCRASVSFLTSLSLHHITRDIN